MIVTSGQDEEECVRKLSEPRVAGFLRKPYTASALTAKVQGTEAVVTVEDTGIGIPAEALPRLFEMFSQVDRNLDRAQGGLGIGLALVKGLTESHGGTVEVCSAGVGKGSSFVVRLPVSPGVPVREKRPLAQIPAVQATIQEAERDLDGTGRVVVRYSGTENVCRVMVEGPKKHQVDQLAANIALAVEKEHSKKKKK